MKIPAIESSLEAPYSIFTTMLELLEALLTLAVFIPAVLLTAIYLIIT